MFEHHRQPMLPRRKWLWRLIRSFAMGVAIIAASLVTGVLGYHFLGPLKWVDAFMEASMILSGMGSIAAMQNSAVKVFASCYALFSGFVLLTAYSIVIAPVLHRFLHHFYKAD